MPDKLVPDRESAAGQRVYCAGPLFNPSEREEMTAIADGLCAAGYAVYLPHRDGMEFRFVHHDLVEQGWPAADAGRFLHEAIFSMDIYQLVEECACLVWNLNGRTPDEGAVSEAAIAWTLGKPIVAYKDDVRSLIHGRDNPLLAGLVDFEMITAIDQIPAALAAAIQAAAIETAAIQAAAIDAAAINASDPVRPGPVLPRAVERAASRGRTLWQAMREHGPSAGNAAIARIVAQLFAGPQGPAAHVTGAPRNAASTD